MARSRNYFWLGLLAAMLLPAGAPSQVSAATPAPITHFGSPIAHKAQPAHHTHPRKHNRPQLSKLNSPRRATHLAHESRNSRPGKLVGVSGKAASAAKPTILVKTKTVYIQLPPKTVYVPQPQPTAPASAVAAPIAPPQTATAPSSRPAQKTNPIDGAEMVWVPAGNFTMGTSDSDDNFDDARPEHTVYLDGYWIYKNDVTVAEYKAFCQATGHAMPEAPSWAWIDNHPMVNVTWDDATAYATWAQVSLPTEAQWEKAARGTDGRSYPWGNDWDPSRCANSVGSRLQSTQPVGSYPTGASPYGALDMAGNVWDWCSDWYDANYYATSPSSNPTGPASGQLRVLRGGSWLVNVPGSFRSAYRNWCYPTDRVYVYGFRCSSRLD